MVAIILAVGGGLEIPARVAVGWLADKRFIPPTAQLAINIVVIGISGILCTVLPGVAGQMVTL